jgi:N-acetylmuramoyl-L-alanine amidase
MLGSMLVLGMLAGAAAPGPKPVLERPFAVVLDAGHGGSNHGCQATDGSIEEKAVALDLADRVRTALLRRLPHAQVTLTRSEDRTMALADRVTAANGAGADVFVSLHANASPHHDQAGFETFVLDTDASSLEAALVARRENGESSSAPLPGGAAPQARTMVEQLRASAHRTAAVALAGAMQREQATRFPGRTDRGVRQAKFDVLLGVRMPAVLFEAAFLDHDTDKAILTDPVALDRVADGVAAALVDHYRRTSRGRVSLASSTADAR